MLHLESVISNEQTLEHLNTFQSRTSTWLVADLTTKLEVQKRLHKKGQVLEEDSVLRATEFWQKLLLRNYPQFRVLSGTLTQTILFRWLQEKQVEWAKGPNSAAQLLTYIEQLLPIILNSDSTTNLIEWLKENPRSLVRWGTWFNLAYEAVEYFLENNWISGQWVSGFLASQGIAADSWQRDIYVDLAGELAGVEIDLLQQLARENDVTVFKPSPSWESTYFSSLWPYKILNGESFYQSYLDEGDFVIEDIENIELKRFSTMTAEIKDAVHQVRLWLEAGVKPNDIAILAPNIELYWPILNLYLEVEGIPVFKDIVTRQHSTPLVMKWLSEIRLQSSRISNFDLEIKLFSNESQMSYERFKQLFSKIYDFSDLNRDVNVYNMLSSKKNSKEVLSKSEFITWGLSLWKSEDNTEAVVDIMQKLAQDVPNGTSFELADWVYYLEKLIAKNEIKVREKQSFGIYCENLSSSLRLPSKKIYVLGCVESELKTVSKSNLSLQDVLALARDLGFHINLPDQDSLEFTLRWLVNDKHRFIVLSSPMTNFSGGVESPSLFWLSQKVNKQQDPEQVDVPRLSLWDRLQLSLDENQLEFKQWPAEQFETTKDLIKNEYEGLAASEVQIHDYISLSVTQLERYASCPFIFLSEKLFKLSDLPDVDLDLDRMTHGRLMHALFEELSKEPISYNLSDNDIKNILYKVKERENLIMASEQVWQSVLPNYIQLAKRFLEFEKGWRDQFKATTTIGREVPIRAEWSLKEKRLVAPGQGDYPFYGYIDRIDSDEKDNCIIVDYKSSASSAKNFNSWLSSDMFQMALYSQALDFGFTRVGKKNTVAALYHVAKNMEKKKGFKLKDYQGELYEINSREKSGIKTEDLQKLFAETNNTVNELVQKISQGNFRPEPKEKDNQCTSCQWSYLCRAQHLL